MSLFIYTHTDTQTPHAHARTHTGKRCDMSCGARLGPSESACAYASEGARHDATALRKLGALPIPLPPFRQRGAAVPVLMLPQLARRSSATLRFSESANQQSRGAAGRRVEQFLTCTHILCPNAYGHAGQRRLVAGALGTKLVVLGPRLLRKVCDPDA